MRGSADAAAVEQQTIHTGTCKLIDDSVLVRTALM